MGAKGFKRRLKNAENNLFGNLYKAQAVAEEQEKAGDEDGKQQTYFVKDQNQNRKLQIDGGQNGTQPKLKVGQQIINIEKSSVEQLQKAGTQDPQNPRKELDGTVASKVSKKAQKRKMREKQRKEEKLQRLKAFMPHEKECVVDKVEFGEQISAPPKINLKRKHWSAKERCNKLFKQQIDQAKSEMEKEKDVLRWKVVDAYRGLKLKGKEPQKANMASLKELVRKHQEMKQGI
eukprot:TRINITY_DN1901_c0_g1_i1.p2 TRINITY_DN1901_c0_g1~~TRINITY_DN1901_c0_g1_i1.p2  ORF type:complete len:274 (-),score=49.45 TRINITY_DN1901_c0_g1_i1:172-870(-)